MLSEAMCLDIRDSSLEDEGGLMNLRSRRLNFANNMAMFSTIAILDVR